MADEVKSECIFCRIIKGEIPGLKVYEDEYSIALLDINPVNPGHTLVIPKQHYENLNDMPVTLAQHLMKVTHQVMNAVKKEVNPSGVNVINNNGRQAGQLVPHCHIHVIPRFSGDEKTFAFIWVTKKLPDEQMKNLQEGIKSSIK